MKELEKLKNASKLSEKDPDMEIISEEERVCLREMGLRIDSSLVLGKKKSFHCLHFIFVESFLLLSIIVKSINVHSDIIVMIIYALI